MNIKKLLAERDSKMHLYYKSVFIDGYEGGYPVEYDNELLAVEQEILNKVVGEIKRKNPTCEDDVITIINDLRKENKYDGSELNQIIN